MRKCKHKGACKFKEDNYVATVTDRITEMIEKKLDNIKTVFPIMLTIVTSLLVFLFTTNFIQSVLWLGYMIIAYLLIAFCSILLAWYPRDFYREHQSIWKIFGKAYEWGKKRLKDIELTPKFSPLNVKSYIKLTDEEFLCELERFCNTKLNAEEILKANMLKQKINELYFKKQFLFVCCTIIIGGALVLAILFVIAFYGANGV